MVLIICTKNESNLTNRYWDMVPDGRTEGRTHGRRQNYIPPTSSGDKKTQKNTNDSQKKYRLGTVSKNILLEDLNQLNGAPTSPLVQK